MGVTWYVPGRREPITTHADQTYGRRRAVVRSKTVRGARAGACSHHKEGKLPREQLRRSRSAARPRKSDHVFA